MSLNLATITREEEEILGVEVKLTPVGILPQDKYPEKPFSKDLFSLMRKLRKNIIMEQGLNSVMVMPYVSERDLDIFAIGPGNTCYRFSRLKGDYNNTF